MPQLLSAMGSLWSLWFGSSVLSVLELLELLIDAVALALLLGCHRIRRVQGSQPEMPPRALTGVSAGELGQVWVPQDC